MDAQRTPTPVVTPARPMTPATAGPAAATAPVPATGPAGPRSDAEVLFDLMSTERAIRHLSPDPVPEATIRALIQAAVWAPTGSNDQGQGYVVVTDRATIVRLGDLWRRVIADFRLATVTAGIRHDDPSSQRIRDAVDYQRDHFEETPVVVVACYDLRAPRRAARSPARAWALLRRMGLRRWLRVVRASRTWMARSEAASIMPGVQNLLLAARALGLGACITTWHLFAEDELRAILGIPHDIDTFALIPIGWPLRPFGPVKRGPVETAIHRDRW